MLTMNCSRNVEKEMVDDQIIVYDSALYSFWIIMFSYAAWALITIYHITD